MNDNDDRLEKKIIKHIVKKRENNATEKMLFF